MLRSKSFLTIDYKKKEKESEEKSLAVNMGYRNSLMELRKMQISQQSYDMFKKNIVTTESKDILNQSTNGALNSDVLIDSNYR